MDLLHYVIPPQPEDCLNVRNLGIWKYKDARGLCSCVEQCERHYSYSYVLHGVRAKVLTRARPMHPVGRLHSYVCPTLFRELNFYGFRSNCRIFSIYYLFLSRCVLRPTRRPIRPYHANA